MRRQSDDDIVTAFTPTDASTVSCECTQMAVPGAPAAVRGRAAAVRSAAIQREAGNRLERFLAASLFRAIARSSRVELPRMVHAAMAGVRIRYYSRRRRPEVRVE